MNHLVSTRILKTKSELAHFSRAYSASFRQRGIPLLTELTLEELMGYDEVHGAVSDGHLVAGFIINQSPKRLVHFEKQGQLPSHILNPASITGVELTAVWRDQEMSGILLWPLVLTKLLRRSLPHGILAAAYPRHRMYETYMRFHPEIIQSANNPNELALFKFSRWQFAITVLAGTALKFPNPVKKLFSWKRPSHV